MVSFLTNTVIPHASLFAFMLALGEVAVGFSFLFGLFTRLGGVIAVLHSVVNIQKCPFCTARSAGSEGAGLMDESGSAASVPAV